MDVIELRGMRVFGKHGADEGERDWEQPFEVHVTMELDLAGPAQSDVLAETVDYAHVHANVTKVVESTSFALLERLASEIMGVVFQDARIARATVQIGKPQLLNGATPSVRLLRDNPRFRAGFLTEAAIGVGSNLGNAPANVREALAHLSEAGTVLSVSSLYRTQPWGLQEQPEFCNAVALIETRLTARELLGLLKTLEVRLGRQPGERWGPRVIDLDILLYGDRSIDEPGLQVPHPRLFERGFALIPLAELDPRYREAVEGLQPRERESVALMSDQALVDRVRDLALAFLETDLVRLRIEDQNEDAIELRRSSVRPASDGVPENQEEPPPPEPVDVDPIKADLVGVFHFSRPAVKEGERLGGDRELAYVEALGIRNPVRSRGAGRIVAVNCKDGQPVEYGQVLFEIARV